MNKKGRAYHPRYLSWFTHDGTKQSVTTASRHEHVYCGQDSLSAEKIASTSSP